MKVIYSKELDCCVYKETGEPVPKRPWKPVAPMVVHDIAPYQSPIDGSVISGRRARRYDMEKNNCVDANELSTPKRLKNKRFIEKHGLQHLSQDGA